MSKLIVQPMLRVSKSPYGGFGVFTDYPIIKGDIVEQCPAIVLANNETNSLPVILQQYIYNWVVDGKYTKQPAILLGYGMLYNHNDNNNLLYNSETLDVDGEVKNVLTFIAARNIETGEELFSNYGENYFKHFNIKKL